MSREALRLFGISWKSLIAREGLPSLWSHYELWKAGLEKKRVLNLAQKLTGVCGNGVDLGTPLMRLCSTVARTESPVVPQAKRLEIPVSAYFLGQRIDLAGVNGDLMFRQCRKGSMRDGLVFEILGTVHDLNSADVNLHVVVFKYGSVVFFKTSHKSDTHLEYIAVCKKYTAEPLAHPNEDVHSLLIRPKMSHWSHQEDNHIILKVLDIDNVKVISSVLGQSVALDQYSKKADRALEEFNSINREIMRTGGFAVDRATLFKLIARNNIMITEAIVTLGLLDRSDIAWKNDRYYAVWSMMQSEYEMHSRFEAMDKKLMLIQQSAKHFLEVLQDNKSNFLEIMIIFLIATEIVVMVFDIVHR